MRSPRLLNSPCSVPSIIVMPREVMTLSSAEGDAFGTASPVVAGGTGGSATAARAVASGIARAASSRPMRGLTGSCIVSVPLGPSERGPARVFGCVSGAALSWRHERARELAEGDGLGVHLPGHRPGGEDTREARAVQEAGRGCRGAGADLGQEDALRVEV